MIRFRKKVYILAIFIIVSIGLVFIFLPEIFPTAAKSSQKVFLRIPEIFLTLIAIAILGIYTFVDGIKTFLKKRLIEDIPTTTIRSIPMGLVEIYGEVLPISDKILRSPFTQKECVYYKYIVEELQQSGKHRTWVVVKSAEDCRHFFLKDATGIVLVDPRGAEVDIPADFFFSSGAGKDIPENLKQFLIKNGISWKGVLGLNKEMKFTEYCIAPKDKLYILGTAGDNPFMAEGWARTGTEDIMIQKDENIFYISDRSEKQVLKRLKIKCIANIIVGALMIISSVFFMFVSFLS